MGGLGYLLRQLAFSLSSHTAIQPHFASARSVSSIRSSIRSIVTDRLGTQNRGDEGGVGGLGKNLGKFLDRKTVRARWRLSNDGTN